MTDADDKMLNRVRALLNKAEDPSCTAHEAEALTAKAAELMARYGIDKAMADAREDKRQKPADKVFDVKEPYAKAKTTLYYNLAQQFGVEAIDVGYKHKKRLHVYGFENDIRTVDILYTSLLLQAANQMQHVPYGINGRSYRVSFWSGFTTAVIGRLQEAKRKTEAEAEQAEPGTALVLRDRALEVRSVFEQAHPRRKTAARTTVTSGTGYRHGERAGQAANLHDRKQAGTAGRASIA